MENGSWPGEATAANLQKPFAIILDGKVISAPTIQSAITSGSGQITGNFSIQEAATLVNLLMRFYELDGGRILLDGQDIAGVTQDSLRGAIAYVGQDALLFDAVRAIAMELCPALQLAIPVGKDSLSMQAQWQADGAQLRPADQPAALVQRHRHHQAAERRARITGTAQRGAHLLEQY